MFTGIIETTGKVIGIIAEGSNTHFQIESTISQELKIDQSIAHNGVCLTVVGITGNSYQVTAIAETLGRTNLGDLVKGSQVNLERCMLLNGRLDGHMVQGHIDETALCMDIQILDGSRVFRFRLRNPASAKWIVSKGSVCVNGISLTVTDTDADEFSVAIIPYTFNHTNFETIKKGDRVNIEFDIIGKYISKQLEERFS